MTLTNVDTIADDDGDRISIDAGRSAVYLTVAPADTESNYDGYAVRLDGPLLARFQEAWDRARKTAGGDDRG